MLQVACSPASSVVEAGDHHEADAVEQRGERQHGAVGTAGDEAHDDVRAQEETHEDRHEEDDSGGTSAFVPSAVIVYAEPVMSAAITSSVSSVLRRRWANGEYARIAPGGELVGDGHGAAVVVTPVGTAAPRWRSGRRHVRVESRSGQSWSAAASSWWSMWSSWWSWSSWRSR